MTESKTNVNFHQIRAFSRVVREGSFSSAAKKLGVSQSALTQHIGNFEARIGAHLFLRKHGGLELTRTGQDFAALAAEFVKVDQALAEKIEQLDRLETGCINVIANAPNPALRMIEKFHRANPHIEVQFALLDWTSAMNRVHKGEVDVAFITSPAESKDLYKRDLEHARFVLYCPKNHRLSGRTSVSLKDLEAEVLLLPEDGSLTGKVVQEAFDTHGLEMQRVIRVTTFPVMKEAILQGVGVGVFLNEGTAFENQLTELPIDEISAEHITCLVTHKTKLDQRIVQRFLSDCWSGGQDIGN